MFSKSSPRSPQADAMRIFEEIQNTLDRRDIDRGKIRTLIDQAASICMAALEPFVAVDIVEATVIGHHMTRSECRLFNCLYHHMGKTFEKRILTDLCWSYRENRSDKTVDVYVCKLRRKLEQQNSPYWIENIWGVGYRMVRLEPGAQRLLHTESGRARVTLYTGGEQRVA